MNFKELNTPIPNFIPVSFIMPNFPPLSGARWCYTWDGEFIQRHIPSSQGVLLKRGGISDKPLENHLIRTSLGLLGQLPALKNKQTIQ